MTEIGKEQRSVEQVRRLLAAIGCPATRIEPLPSQGRSRPDVLVEICGRKIKIMIETTDYHGDERQMGGSDLRKQEEKDAREGRLKTYGVPIDPLPGLTKRIEEKTKKRYDVSGADEVWLAIFAGVPQPGAVASTLIDTTFLDCGKLNTQTGLMLQNSQFSRCYVFCELTEKGHPVAYCWTKEDQWQEIEIKVRQEQIYSAQPPSFWDIQKGLKE